MHIIPKQSRIGRLVLLVGATAREQERQVKRLKQFIEAEQDPQDDFGSFRHLVICTGLLDQMVMKRLQNSILTATNEFCPILVLQRKPNYGTNQHLRQLKIDLDQVINIWTKTHIKRRSFTAKCFSFTSNLGTLYLSGILEGTNTNEAILNKAFH